MTAGTDFRELLRGARSGDSAALAEIARVYEKDLRIAARVHLGAPLKPYLDSLDLVQSVHRSLMLGLRNEKFDVTSPERLIALALTMVRRKAARQWRRHRRQQRDRLPEPKAKDSQATLESQDVLEQLWLQLSGPERELLDLRLAGYSTAQAARMLKVPAETLRVRLHRLRQRCQVMDLE